MPKIFSLEQQTKHAQIGHPTLARLFFLSQKNTCENSKQTTIMKLGNRTKESPMPSEEMRFQRELIDAMHAGLAAVCARLRLRVGSPASDRAALAIVDLAKAGECDPKRLALLALSAIAR
jgi:hypothetical protein